MYCDKKRLCELIHIDDWSSPELIGLVRLIGRGVYQSKGHNYSEMDDFADAFVSFAWEKREYLDWQKDCFIYLTEMAKMCLYRQYRASNAERKRLGKYVERLGSDATLLCVD